MVKNSLANAGNAGLIPRSIRSPKEGNGIPLSVLSWEIPWTEESDGLQSMGLQRVRHDLATEEACKRIHESRGVIISWTPDLGIWYIHDL